MKLRRFGLVLAVVLAAVTGNAGVAYTDPAPPAAAVALRLPAPTGPYSVGVTEVHLVDSGRADPWHPDQRRELMVQIWYPAAVDRGAPAAPWMPSGGRQAQNAYLDELGVPEGSWILAPSHSHQDAPALTGHGRFPILLNSPGMTDTTGWSTAQAEDLAGHGYAVVAINHTHEAFSVHFPDGRETVTEVALDSPQEVLRDLLLPTRVADTRFVLDRLAEAAGGPDSQQVLPPALAARLDLSKVGMFGHSLGGSTTAQAIHDDPRLRAGANLDGPILGSVASDGLDRPLLMLASGNYPWSDDPGWQPGWPNNTGLKIPLRMEGTEHMSFCDQQAILPQLAAAGLLPADTVTRTVGGIDPDRSIDLQRDYLRAYFDAAFGRIGTDIVGTITGLAQPEMLPHPLPDRFDTEAGLFGSGGRG
ncbi:alpha/beta hydrolase family protein [Nocardia grenadensis]|uniref:alpha/beta hydrolase family protein n=1 Tax=Nocardia grenadensis TaxID=931537 RepID=UPI003D75B7E8